LPHNEEPYIYLCVPEKRLECKEAKESLQEPDAIGLEMLGIR
jgi:hypothetical protein